MTGKDLNRARPNNEDRLVSRRLKQRRVMLGISQGVVAEHLGVSIQQIQKYEMSRNRVSSGNLYRLAKLLKVDINYFFNEEDADSLRGIRANGETEHGPARVSEKEVISMVKAFIEISNRTVRSRFIELARSVG